MSEPQGLLLEAVSELATMAGRVALTHFGKELRVETKTDGSPVTIADRAAEVAARDCLSARFPDDDVFGEEFGATKIDARRRWIIDPIDGTKTYVRGVPLWGTLVALCEGDEVLAGAASFPALNEIVAAERSGGAWWNGARCRVSDVSSVSS